jgi:hypothetical protein
MIPIKNDGATTRYIGGRAILPGETVVFDESQVPGLADPPAPAAPPPVPDWIEMVARGSVASIEKAVLDLTDKDLTRLQDFEDSDAGLARKGVYAAIDKERMDRANFAEQLAQAKPEELAGLAEQYAGRQGFMRMIEARINPND